MSFTSRYCSWNANPSAGIDVLFPYWNDLDFKLKNTTTGAFVGGVGVSQHTHVQTDSLSTAIFNETKKYLATYGNISNFSPTDIIVGTWIKATPYPSTNYVNDPQVSGFPFYGNMLQL